MKRRSLLAGGLAALIAPLLRPSVALAEGPPRKQTRWRVRASEGLDAIAFLGPLSGVALYQDYYASDSAAFAPRLPEAVRSDIGALWAAAGAEGFGLLGPALSVLLSTDGNDASIDALLTAIDGRAQRILPRYKTSPYWSDQDWAWFEAAAPRVKAILVAMRDAGFAQFRAERTPGLAARIAEVQRALDGFNVISWQEKLTGHTFDPTIEIVLLQFAKPHGIKVQGQTFLQAIDYDTAATVRIAAHELLHPPVPMDGAAAKAALALLGRDALLVRIVREHDPRWGSRSLDGLLNEDLCQALDQLIAEGLGVAHNPADRWRKSDDGMHVLAAGFYGLLRRDRWVERGGVIEAWLADAVRGGDLSPAMLHPVAARVLERPAGRLWPLDKA